MIIGFTRLNLYWIHILAQVHQLWGQREVDYAGPSAEMVLILTTPNVKRQGQPPTEFELGA